MELVRCGDAATKNAGRENDGPSKSRCMKLQDMKMTDRRYRKG